MGEAEVKRSYYRLRHYFKHHWLYVGYRPGDVSIPGRICSILNQLIDQARKEELEHLLGGNDWDSPLAGTIARQYILDRIKQLKGDKA